MVRRIDRTTLQGVIEMKHTVKRRRLRRALCLAALCLGVTGNVWAAEPGTIFHTDIEDDSIVIYAYQSGDIEDAQCQIGTVVCSDVVYEKIADLEAPCRTLLLIDNSISIMEKYRPQINEIMNNLVANRMEGELVSVAAFSDVVTYLIEDSDDSEELKNVIDGIHYQDQETYLTDVLYDILKQWESDGADGFRRVVIISDGVDSKAIGYTKDELYELIRQNPYPIYTLGCKSKSSGNSEALENMFALSRLTKGESWLLDDLTGSDAVVSRIAEDSRVWKVTVNPPTEVCDGSQKGVKLTVTAEGEEYVNSIQMDMPLRIAEISEAVTEMEAETITEPETAGQIREERKTTAAILESTENGEISDARPAGNKTLLVAIIAGAAVLAAGAIIAAVLQVLKTRKEANRFIELTNMPEKETPVVRNMVSSYAPTEMLDDSSDRTALVWGNDQMTNTLILSDQDNPARTFQVPLTGTVVLGRDGGCQIVLDYAKTVSRRHCQLRLDQGRLMVRDLGSHNGTLVNGNRIVEETEIYSGSILKLGSLSLKVELR